MVSTRSQQKEYERLENEKTAPSESALTSPPLSKTPSTRTSPRKQIQVKIPSFEVTKSSTTRGPKGRNSVNGVKSKVNGSGITELKSEIKVTGEYSDDDDQGIGGVQLGEEVVDDRATINGVGKKKWENLIRVRTVQVVETAEESDYVEVDSIPNGAALKSEESGESDDEEAAPEVISNAAGKEFLKAREEDTRRAIRNQIEEAREKRRQRDTKLKEQKEAALKRRRTEDEKAVVEEENQEGKKKAKTTDGSINDNATSDTFSRPTLPTRLSLDVLQQNGSLMENHAEIDRNTTPTSTTLSAAPPVFAVPPPRNKKLPLLLPQSLLEEVASRPSPPPVPTSVVKIHKKASDFESENASFKKKMEKRIWKRGPVAVAVLDRTEGLQRKSMAPKSVIQSMDVRNNWMTKGSSGNKIEREKSKGCW